MADMLSFEAGGESRQGRVWFADERAFAEWSYDAIGEDGKARAVRGIDVIHLVDDRIGSIDAYRKSWK